MGLRPEPFAYAITFLPGDGIFIDHGTQDQPGRLQHVPPAYKLTMERLILESTLFDRTVRCSGILVHHALRFFSVAANVADGQEPRGQPDAVPS